MPAYGYVRKSRVHDPARELSPAAQEAAIRSLAARHGDEEVIVLSDLDVSGKKGRGARRGWDRLLRAIESGETHAVYAFSLSRFARSVVQLADFAALCKDRGVAFRCDQDAIDTSSSTGMLTFHVIAAMAQFESDVASERVRAVFRHKREIDPTWTGPGQPEYGGRGDEDPALVVEAFREAGSWNGAARLLNDRGVPTRVPGRRWSGTVVRDVVERTAPELAPARHIQGARAAGPRSRAFRFGRLMECSFCVDRWEASGRAGERPPMTLTASYDPRHDTVRYECTRGRTTTAHPRRWVSESVVAPLIAAEARRLRLVSTRHQVGSLDDEAEAQALEERRVRVLDMYETGDITKAEKDRRLAAIADAEASLTSARWVRRLRVPPDAATGDPATVNEFLQRLWSRVTIDMSEPAKRGPSRWTPPLAFVWADPAMRMTDDEIREMDEAVEREEAQGTRVVKVAR